VNVVAEKKEKQYVSDNVEKFQRVGGVGVKTYERLKDNVCMREG